MYTATNFLGEFRYHLDGENILKTIFLFLEYHPPRSFRFNRTNILILDGLSSLSMGYASFCPTHYCSFVKRTPFSYNLAKFRFLSCLLPELVLFVITLSFRLIEIVFVILYCMLGLFFYISSEVSRITTGKQNSKVSNSV